MPLDADDALLRALDEHNPWWDGESLSLPARQRSDFYHLARPGGSGSQFEDQRLLGLVGRRGVGKTTLLLQFVQHRIDAGADPEQFLYLPFDADPLYQLRSDEQLRRAVQYYESRVLGRSDADGPQFVLLDDVHRIEHPNKPTDGWGSAVSDILDGAPDRHVAVTASAGVQVDRELSRVEFPASAYDVQPVLPEKFRDYLYTLYPDLETEDRRVSPTSIRTGARSLPATLRSGEVVPLVSELRAKYDRVADDQRRIQSQVLDYLAMGGLVSYDRDGAVASAADATSEDYERLRDDVRDALYREVPEFESIQTVADLERLCALAARNRAAEPLRYQDLVESFDVDRRTIADSYLPALSELYLLTGVTEYDNSRPRSVRLYLRDTGLVTALAASDAPVRTDFDREVDLARLAGFDHTMRLAYGVAAANGAADPTPTVQYWRGRNGVVDFVFEVAGTPVPVGFGYRPRDRSDVRSALEAFRRTYDAPVGFLLVDDPDPSTRPVETISDGLIQLPYWFYLLLC
ncbi:MAG: ATP-binding protein [Haloplanus sp.]